MVERGGQWVGPSQVRLLALAAELGVETFEHHHTGTPIYRIADFAAAAGELTALNTELDRLAATLPAGMPWRAEHAAEWDRQTFHTWLAGRSCSPAVLAYLHLITTGLFTAEPDELPLLHVLAYIRSAGSMHDLAHARAALLVLSGLCAFMSAVPGPTFGPWDVRLRAMAMSVLSLNDRYPWASDVMTARYRRDASEMPSVSAGREAIQAILRDAGFAPGPALLAGALISTVLTGLTVEGKFRAGGHWVEGEGGTAPSEAQYRGYVVDAVLEALRRELRGGRATRSGRPAGSRRAPLPDH